MVLFLGVLTEVNVGPGSKVGVDWAEGLVYLLFWAQSNGLDWIWLFVKCDPVMVFNRK